MITPIFKPEWRTQNRLKRRIYTKYMTWLERGGYLAVAIIIGLFIGSFVYRVDDNITAQSVSITPATTKFVADDQTYVVRVIPADFAEVKKGEPLLEIVKGDEAIRHYRLWEAIQSAKAAGDQSVASINQTKPLTQLLTAAADGTFRTEAKAGSTLGAKDLLARLLDYNNLEAIGSFKGDTVPAAREGQVASISGISVDTGNDTIVRATSPLGAIVSRSIAGDEIKKTLESSLKGSAVRLRDDLPLEVKSVSSVEVDAVVNGQPASASELTLDPPPNMQLTGAVTHGEQMAEIQIAALPDDARKAADAALTHAVEGKNVAEPNGSALTISSIGDAKYVVKAKAKVSDTGASGKLTGSPLSRSFDATVKIDSPPSFLIEKVRAADRLGKFVTAKVSIKTGTRPIALILLRRS